jgi:ABC-type multidrug transport system permease subunit
MGKKRKKSSGIAGRYFGYLLLPIIVYGWASGNMSASFILIASSLAVLYMLFAVPAWCMATTREGLSCRRNSNGLLLGCSLREHKWQKLKMAVRASKWGELFGKFWSNTASAAAAVSAMAGVGSALAATVTLATK